MAGYTTRDFAPGYVDDLLHRAEDRMPEVITIDADALDAGNVGNTSVLRKGLVLCKVTLTGKYVPYSSVGADGSENEATAVVLAFDTRMDGEDDKLSTAYFDAKLKPEGPKFTSTTNADAFDWTTPGLSGRLVIVDTRVV